jgi:hypothetical protein
MNRETCVNKINAEHETIQHCVRIAALRQDDALMGQVLSILCTAAAELAEAVIAFDDAANKGICG